MSAGALSGADVREGKEISVEPRDNLALCSRAFALKVHPSGVRKVEISSRSVHNG